MTTFKDLKNWFAREVGEIDYTAVDKTGEYLINDAYKELSSRTALECNKKSAAITFVSNAATIPTDFDYAHEHEVTLYAYSGTEKTDYEQKDLDDLSAYGTDSYVFAFDHENNKVKSNQTSTVPTLKYFAVPADLANNADTLKFPIPKAIAVLAAANYWNGVEGEEKRADKCRELAELLYSQTKSRNQKIKANRKVAHPFKGLDLGFN